MLFFKKKKKARNAPEESTQYYDETKLRAGELAASRKTTIGVAGAMPRIGATTIALQIAYYIFYETNQNVAYIQANRSSFLDDLKEQYSDIRMDRHGNIEYNRLSLVRREDIQTVTGDDYDVLVFDYGSCTASDFDSASYMERNTQVLVGGSSPEELKNTTIALSDKTFLNAKVLFNFVPKDDRDAVAREMTGRDKDVFYTAYMPDMFTQYASMNNVFAQIVPGKE